MTTSTPTKTEPGKLRVLALTALVVGSMIGSGIFSLPQNMAAGSGAGAILLGWVITAAGMLTLAFVFQNLARRQPGITGGVYGYARAGFGNFVGFSSAWGYWLSAFIGNVSYLIVLMSAMSYFLPKAGLGEGNTVPAIVGASVLLWALHFLILSGVRTAAFINTLTTIAKIVPLALFILLVVLAFRVDTFSTAFWGDPKLGDVLQQVKSTMLVTVWAFIGIEGASVYSARAARMADVGRATVIGFLITLVLLMAISLLSMGILTQPELAALKNPSMAGVLEKVVGPWGAGLVNLGLIISVAGALLAWTLLAAELPFLAAADGMFPAVLARTNRRDAPVAALWLTNIAVQIFLILSYVASNAYLTMIKLATSTILVPYLLCAGYACLIAWRSEGYAATESRGRDKLIGVVGVIYGLWLIYAAGPAYLMLTALLYAPGTLIFAWARRERGEPVFKGAEWLVAAASAIAFVVCAVLIANGTIDLSKL